MIKDSYQKLKITQFGNPVLRQVASNLSISEIKSPETKHLINKMREFLKTKKLGIGLAAPQVGVSKQIAIIEIQKTPIRDNIEPLSLAIINPEITKNYGRKTQLWEGCISCGSGSAALFAKVPRHKKLELEYYDENGTKVTTVKTSATSSETKTGDDINIGLLILLVLIGVAGAITPFALRKKAKEESDK